MALRPLTNEERGKMRHALGFDNRDVAYRNRYITSGRNELWEGLCAIGAAARDTYGEDEQWCYWVTQAGYDAVREPSERAQRDTVFTHPN